MACLGIDTKGKTVYRVGRRGYNSTTLDVQRDIYVPRCKACYPAVHTHFFAYSGDVVSVYWSRRETATYLRNVRRAHPHLTIVKG